MASSSLVDHGRVFSGSSSAVRPSAERESGPSSGGGGSTGEPGHRHADALEDPLRQDVQPGRGDGHHREGATPAGELEGDPGAEGVAEHVHPADAFGVQGALDRVGDRGDRRALVQVPGAAGAGQVDVEDVEALGQRGEDGGEVAARTAPAVQEEKGVALPGSGEGQWRGHGPWVPGQSWATP